MVPAEGRVNNARSKHILYLTFIEPQGTHVVPAEGRANNARSNHIACLTFVEPEAPTWCRLTSEHTAPATSNHIAYLTFIEPQGTHMVSM